MPYLDTNVFVKAALDSAAGGEVLRSILVKGKKFSTSALTYDEFVWTIRKRVGLQESVEAGKGFLSIANLRLLSADRLVLNEAQYLLEHYPLGPRDAIHAATALVVGETEIVSDDPDFDHVKSLHRVAIADFKI